MPVTQYGICFQNIYFSSRQNNLFKIEILCNCQIHKIKREEPIVWTPRECTLGRRFRPIVGRTAEAENRSAPYRSTRTWRPWAANPQYYHGKVCPPESTAAENHQGTTHPTARTTSTESRPATHNHTGRPGQHLPRMKPQLHGSTGILGPEKVLEDREALLDPWLASLMERPTTAVNNVQDIKRECPLEQGKQIHSDQTGTLTPRCGQGRHARTIGKETWSNTVVHLTHWPFAGHLPRLLYKRKEENSVLRVQNWCGCKRHKDW